MQQTATAISTIQACDPMAGAVAPAERWLGPRDLRVAVALSALAVVVTFDAWRSIFELGAFREELSYVLLAPVMIVWIACMNRDRWTRCRARNGWVGLLILAAGFGIFQYGFIADPVLWRGGAVVMVAGAFLSAAGTDALWAFLPVFGACVFLIPIDPNGRYKIAEPLQVATAQATQTVCDILGIYVDRAGNMLSINGVDVTVAEACNGMRMVMTLFLVCYLVAFTSPLKGWVRIALLVLSPLVAIVANVVRLVPTVWVFGHFSRETAEGFHTAAGWVMIVVAFLVLMGLCRLVQHVLTMDDAKAPAPPGPAEGKGVRS